MNEELIPPSFITNFVDRIEKLQIVLLKGCVDEKLLIKEYHFYDDELRVIFKTLHDEKEVAMLVNKDNRIMFYEKSHKGE